MLSIFFDHIRDAAKQDGRSLEEMCAYAKQVGYDGVHMNMETVNEENLVLLGRAGLQVLSIFAFEDYGDGETVNALERARVLVRNTVSAGCRNLMIIPGFLREGILRNSPEYELTRQNMAKVLNAVMPLVREAGLTLLLEDFDGERAPFLYPEELMWFLEAVPGLRCAFDTGNFAFGDRDSGKEFDRFAPYISDVHLKDRSFTENDGGAQVTVGGKKMYPCAVGDGEMPIRRIVSALLEQGYTGCFALEHYGSLHQTRDIERSFRAVKEMLG